MSPPERLPTFYLSHGGGPWPFMDLGPERTAEMQPLADYLRALFGRLPQRPRAVLMVSAHWEAPVATLMTHPRPPMLYDYYGFPPDTYRLEWPAPGAPELAPKVRALLEAAGFEVASDPARGFDHGTFVPMMLALPEADLPVLQLSLLGDMDPARHLALGAALAPLRDDGVLLLGSGNSYHNMRGFGQASSTAPSRAFDEWLVQTVGLPGPARRERLADWASAPGARACHPREEHLLPLHVVAGAAGDDLGRATLQVQAGAVCNTCVQFG
jgi:aromatic ring-opening dioxygenase catalytic subunit (LigB family)